MLDVRGILRDLGISYTEGGYNLKAVCWNPEHKDSNPSMSIHLETGVFHCLGCGYKGHILGLAQKKLGYSYYESHKYLVEQVKVDKTEDQIYEYLKQRMTRRKDKKELPEVRIPEHRLIESHPYLEKRGFTSDEIARWKMGEITGEKELYNKWIYIPVYFQGVLRTWFLRSPFNDKKLYGYYMDQNRKAVGYPRADILFGLDECTDKNKKLYIVEGIFDKIWFDRTGQQTVACLSNRILREQIAYLKHYKHIVLVPDNDLKKKDEGLLLVESALALAPYCKVSVCVLPLHKKDCNECALEELLESTYKEVSIFDFINTERYITWCSRKLFRLQSMQ